MDSQGLPEKEVHLIGDNLGDFNKGIAYKSVCPWAETVRKREREHE